MKALILAAGFGTRLEPYTRQIPKPLFTLASKPILAHAIDALVQAGCSHILINTHHLGDQISAFVATYKTTADIEILHEPDILDTGGAIANARHRLDDAPFFVVNADIISSINLKQLYHHHLLGDKLATLVLHDSAPFNKVEVDDNQCITSFDSKNYPLAFTGVQVVSPQIFDYLPDKTIFSCIALYSSLCPQQKIGAYVDKSIFWSDIGTPNGYSLTSMMIQSASYFGISRQDIHLLKISPVAGDGSDRLWVRVKYENQSIILCSHGICIPDSDKDNECRSFIKIGTHLNAKGLNAPKVLGCDRMSGIVSVQDLGDTHLQAVVNHYPDSTIDLYKKVIDLLIDFSFKGAQDFDPDWTCQTRTYSKELILENECRYFMDAFINGYLGLDHSFDDFKDEFDLIAEQALEHGMTGLMHRDMQSRNIMVQDNRIYFIDFQSARLGPLQYDLASLLIDPYVDLGSNVKKTLVMYAMETLNLKEHQKEKFLKSYSGCCLTRNLQALGAYGFLSRIKNKKIFEQYIPCAVKSLKKITQGFAPAQIPKLSQLIANLKGDLK